MRSLSFSRTGFFILGLPLLACGATQDLYGPEGSESGSGPGRAGTLDEGSLVVDDSLGTPTAAPFTFPGAGSSGAAAPLTAALAPDSISSCFPEPSSTPATSAEVQTVCFYGPDSAEEPAAVIEQVVEIVGTERWVHLRLTLDPDFVDNTYGDTAIGWDRGENESEPATPAEGGAPPAPGPRGDGPPAPGAAPEPPRGDAPPAPEPPAPPPGDAPPAPEASDAGPLAPPDGPEPPDGADAPDAGPPPPPRGGADGAPRPRPGRGGHSFRDLLGSDHAEIQLLDAAGGVAVHFKIDYLSESAAAASGYGSLGVSGGEGEIIVGDPEWFLAATTSLDRNLNACGLSSFTESSPETDAAYTQNGDAPEWDYRVAYEVWVSSEAFGGAGFGSALIENVHASPSKLEGNTVDVVPAPCPADPNVPDAVPAPVPVVLQNIR